MREKANTEFQQSEIGKRLKRLGEQNYAKDPVKGLPVIARGSPEWHAWRDWRKEHGEPVNFMDRQERWTVPQEWPPIGDVWGKDAGVAGKLKG